MQGGWRAQLDNLVFNHTVSNCLWSEFLGRGGTIPVSVPDLGSCRLQSNGRVEERLHSLRKPFESAGSLQGVSAVSCKLLAV
jgi:hypothetical protein